MPGLKNVEKQHIDELALKTKELRDCAEDEMKDSPLAEKLQSVVSAWERVTTLMIKRRSSKQISTEEQTTPTNGTGTQPTNKLTNQMSQAAAVLRP